MRLVNKAEAVFAVLHHDKKLLDLQTPDTLNSFQLKEPDNGLLASIFNNPDMVASVARLQRILAESGQENPTDLEVHEAVQALIKKLEKFHKCLKSFLVPMASGYMLHHSWEAVQNQKAQIPEIFHTNLNNAVQTVARQANMVSSICKHMPKAENNDAYVLDAGRFQKDLDFILKTYDVVISLILEETKLDSKTMGYKAIEKQLHSIKNYLNLSAVEESDLANHDWPGNYINRCYKAIHKLAWQLKDF